MGLSQHGFLILGYTLASAVLVCQTVYALVCSYIFRKKNAKTEVFVTARNMMDTWKLAWAFYATSVGGWIVMGPAQYSPYAGMIGAFMYAFACGATVPLTAAAGVLIRGRLAHPWSIADYVGWRFGWVARTYITLYIGVQLSIGMLAEYTSAATLLGDYLGAVGWPICIVVFVLSTTYTVFGGLVVSIYTDQVQGVCSAILIIVCAIYMAAKFRPTLPKPMPCNADDPMGFCISGKNSIGYSSIFTQPASIFANSFFYEPYWQRAWAAQSDRTLMLGASFGGLMAFCAVLFSGMAGLFAAWGGYITEDTNPNLYFLQALPGAVNSDGMVGNWIGIVVILLMVTMNMGNIDSCQNGMAAAFSSYFFKHWKKSLLWTRAFVFFVNIPLVVLATKNYSVLELFLLIFMLASCSAFPLLLGLVKPLYPYMGGLNFFLSSLGGILFTSVYGCNRYWDDNASQGSFNDAMHYTWMANLYEWQFFAVTLGTSLGSSLLLIALTFLGTKLGLPKPAVPGFMAPVTHPDRFPPEEEASEGDEDEAGVGTPEKTKNGDEEATASALPPDTITGGHTHVQKKELMMVPSFWRKKT